MLRILKNSGRTLSELANEIEIYPQVTVIVCVSKIGKVRYSADEEIKKAIKSAENELSNSGRVLVRVSGTEPLVRVMVEGKNEAQIKKLADEIATVVKQRLI